MIKDVEARGILMATASTKKSSCLTILNKTRSIIEPNKTIHVGKLTNRHKIHRKLGYNGNIRNGKLGCSKIAMMSNCAGTTVSSLNMLTIWNRLT